ncbi:MAG: leucyl/phenylalanyl-tRNA--protein transferase [Thermodesulfobacteriota bacterium]
MPLFVLGPSPSFPDPRFAGPGGLLALGGDLSPERLIAAYRQGIFPWYNEGDPILWWSPDPRFILEPCGLHVSRRLSRLLRQGRFSVTLDTCFPEVISRCALVHRQHQGDTWLVDDMIRAYCRLAEPGFCHSVEVWEGGALAGGLYGVSLGSGFFAESMFHHTANASKAALVFLCRFLMDRGFTLLDCQVRTPHMETMGAREVERGEFLNRLSLCLERPTLRGRWSDLM